MNNNMKDRPDYYLSHTVCPCRPSWWFQAPNHDVRNFIIRNTTFFQIWRDNPYHRFQVRDINRKIRELLQDYSPFMLGNGRLSNVSYEVNTSQSINSHSRYILYASAQFIMIADRNVNSEREFARNLFGTGFHEHYYIPLFNTNRGLTFDAVMKMLEEIGEFMNIVLIGG